MLRICARCARHLGPEATVCPCGGSTVASIRREPDDAGPPEGPALRISVPLAPDVQKSGGRRAFEWGFAIGTVGPLGLGLFAWCSGAAKINLPAVMALLAGAPFCGIMTALCLWSVWVLAEGVFDLFGDDRPVHPPPHEVLAKTDSLAADEGQARLADRITGDRSDPDDTIRPPSPVSEQPE